jgi:RNA-directed DNA polymerase
VPLGIPKSTFYHWYDRYLTGGVEAQEDQNPTPHASWNKGPEETRQALVERARDLPELSPRELAVRFTDERRDFVSEATAYRILKAHDLVTSPAWIVLKAADQFDQSTTAINQLWQTGFPYLKVTGWGWYYLSTVMDDFSRHILAWRLCQTMSAREGDRHAQGGVEHGRVNQKATTETTQ